MRSAREKYVSIEDLRHLLNYNPDTGVFVWAQKSSTRMPVGRVAGCAMHDGYISIKVKGVLYGAHRLAWAHYYGAWPIQRIDHINGIKSDNRISNLRDCSPSINSLNLTRGNRLNKSTGIVGVSFKKRDSKFEARIIVGGVNRYLGSFRDLNSAVAARKSAEAELGIHVCVQPA